MSAKAEAFVESFLAHYASPYYDPVKAREYYLRTRELKGKQSTAELTDNEKQAWAYARNQIGEAKKTDLKAASESRKGLVDKARLFAQARREEIGAKLTDLFASLTNEGKEVSEELSVQKEQALAVLDDRQRERSNQLRFAAQKKIDALPKIPEGVSDERRAVLTARREQQVARINGTLKSDLKTVKSEIDVERAGVAEATEDSREAVSALIKTEKTAGRETARVDRETVRTELKATVDKARADYEANRERLIAEYEATKQREYDAIKALPGSKPPPKRRSSSSRKE